MLSPEWSLSLKLPAQLPNPRATIQPMLPPPPASLDYYSPMFVLQFYSLQSVLTSLYVMSRTSLRGGQGRFSHSRGDNPVVVCISGHDLTKFT